MKPWLKRLAWLLVALVLLPLLLVAAWLACNIGDADPQPVPAPLAPPNAQSGEGVMLSLLGAWPTVPVALVWPDCTGSDCAAVFDAKADEWLRWRESQARFGAACEALLSRPELVLGEALPATWSIDTVTPNYQPLSACHGWMLTGAWQAGQRGDGEAMLGALRAADQIERLVRDQSQLLVGQMVAASYGGRKLKLIAALAARHPQHHQALAGFADADAQLWMAAMRRWIPAEAAFGRAVLLSLRTPAVRSGGAVAGGDTWWDRGLTRLSGHFVQPEFTQQLFDAHWLRVLNCLKGDSLMAAANCASVEPESGPLPGGLHWRHTVPYILRDVAVPGWVHYTDRIVDLFHATQATQAWLRGQPPTPAVAAAGDGTWTLRLRDARQGNRIPTHWAPLPKDR